MQRFMSFQDNEWRAHWNSKVLHEKGKNSLQNLSVSTQKKFLRFPWKPRDPQHSPTPSPSPPPDKYWLVSDETTNQVLKITTSKRSTSLPDEDLKYRNWNVAINTRLISLTLASWNKRLHIPLSINSNIFYNKASFFVGILMHRTWKWSAYQGRFMKERDWIFWSVSWTWVLNKWSIIMMQRIWPITINCFPAQRGLIHLKAKDAKSVHQVVYCPYVVTIDKVD